VCVTEGEAVIMSSGGCVCTTRTSGIAQCCIQRQFIVGRATNIACFPMCGWGYGVLHPPPPLLLSVVFVCVLCAGCYGAIYIIICSWTLSCLTSSMTAAQCLVCDSLGPGADQNTAPLVFHLAPRHLLGALAMIPAAAAAATAAPPPPPQQQQQR
jgi:hypothetical protein